METLVKLNASLLQSTPITTLLTRSDKPLQHQIFIMHWNTLKSLDESLAGPCVERASNSVNSTEFLPVVSGCYRDKVPTLAVATKACPPSCTAVNSSVCAFTSSWNCCMLSLYFFIFRLLMGTFLRRFLSASAAVSHFWKGSF